MSERDEIERLALRYDRATINASGLAFERGAQDRAHFLLERAVQYATIAETLHRLKDNLPPTDAEFQAEHETQKAA